MRLRGESKSRMSALEGRRRGRRASRVRCDDAAGGVLGRLAHDAAGEVGIALGRRDLAVTQHFADDRRGHAAHQRVAGERVPQVQETVIRPTNLPEEAIFHCLLKSSSYPPKPWPLC